MLRSKQLLSGFLVSGLLTSSLALTTVIGSAQAALMSKQTPNGTLDASLNHLMNTNQQILAAQADASSSKSAVHTAVSAYLPSGDATFEAGSEKIYNPGSTANTSTGFHEEDVDVSQLITDFGGTTSSIHIADENYYKAENTLKQTRQNVLVQGITAYANMVRDTVNLDYVTKNEARVQDQVKVEQKKLLSGQGYRTDLLEVNAQLSGAKARLVRAKAALVQAENFYRATFKKDPGSFVGVKMPGVPTSFLPKNVNEAIATAEKMNPRLANLKLDTKIADNEITSAHSDFLPDIDAEGAYKYKRNVDGTIGTKRELQADVSVNYNFFSGFGSVSKLHSAKYDLYSAQENLSNTDYTIEEQVRNDWETYESSQKNTAYLEKQADQLQKFLELAKKERKMGRRSLVDVLVADTNHIDAETRAMASQAATVVAAYTLLQSMGVLKLDMALSSNQVDMKHPFHKEVQLAAAKAIPVASPTVVDNATPAAKDADTALADNSNSTDLPTPFASSNA